LTVPSVYSPPKYTGNGSTTIFGFPYNFFAPSDLGVSLFNTSTGAAALPAPVLGGGATYDYTVSGTIDAETGEYLSGAAVVFNTAPPGNYTVTLTRAVGDLQQTSFTDNGPFPAKAIEGALDRLTMLAQQNLSGLVRAVTAPVTDPPGLVLVLPPSTTRANQLAGFDSQGNLIVAQPSSALVSSAMVAFVDSASTAAAAQVLGVAAVTSLKSFGAKGDGVTNDTVAFLAWFAAVLATKVPGYAEPGHYIINSQVSIDLSNALVGVRIFGAGGNQTVFDLSAVSASPAMLLHASGGATFYFGISGIAVKGNVAGTVLAIGTLGGSDAANKWRISDLIVNNLSTSTSAVGLQLNGVYNSTIDATVNCAGHGTALQLTVAQFSVFTGGYATADVGIALGTSYNYGNVFLGIDSEVVNTCVAISNAQSTGNTFIGGAFVWTNGGGPPVAAINATSGAVNRFIGVSFGSAPPIATGTVGIIIEGQGIAIGTDFYGGVAIAPLTGDGVLQLNSVAGNASYVAYETGGVLRWSVLRNTTAESGGNSGSNLQITRYSDAGSAIDSPLVINRATGLTTITALGVTAGIGVWNHGAPGSQPTISGSRSSATVAVLAALLTALDATGVIVNGTSS
jgi:hypothetical protein